MLRCVPGPAACARKRGLHTQVLRCLSALLDSGPQGSEPRCPQCRAFRPEGVRPNWQLVALVDSVQRLLLAKGTKGDAGLCVRHGQELSLFCSLDRHALCGACAAGEEHRGHSMVALQEAAEEHRVRSRGHRVGLDRREWQETQDRAEQGTGQHNEGPGRTGQGRRDPPERGWEAHG